MEIKVYLLAFTLRGYKRSEVIDTQRHRKVKDRYTAKGKFELSHFAKRQTKRKKTEKRSLCLHLMKSNAKNSL